MKTQTTQETITPTIAAEYLERHFDRIAKGEFLQRSIAPRVVGRFAADMRIGKWLVCPQPIVFDEKDNLIDGQHRLEAVRQSGCTVEMMVSRGWPISQNGTGTIDVIDRGRPRSVAAQLALHGQPRACVLASSVASVARLLYSGKSIPLSYAQTLYMLDDLDLKKHILKICDQMGNRAGAGRLWGPLAYYRTTKPNKADEFAHRLHTLDVEKGTAVQAFARFNRDRATGSSQQDYIKTLSSALRAWDANESVSFLRGTPEALKWLLASNPKLSKTITECLKPKVEP